jgi:hypothetical protein
MGRSGVEELVLVLIRLALGALNGALRVGPDGLYLSADFQLASSG